MFDNIYVKLGIAIVVAGLIFLYSSFMYHNGYNAAESVWKTRENVELVAANTKIVELTTSIRLKEQGAAAQIAAVDGFFRQREINANAKLKNALARVAAGNGLLSHTTCQSPDASSGTTASSGVSGDNAAKRVELSRQDSEFLLGLAGEADTVASQLTACQAVIKEDRKLINGN